MTRVRTEPGPCCPRLVGHLSAFCNLVTFQGGGVSSLQWSRSHQHHHHQKQSLSICLGRRGSHRGWVIPGCEKYLGAVLWALSLKGTMTIGAWKLGWRVSRHSPSRLDWCPQGLVDMDSRKKLLPALKGLIHPVGELNPVLCFQESQQISLHRPNSHPNHLAAEGI